jgi:hypothetical protein
MAATLGLLVLVGQPQPGRTAGAAALAGLSQAETVSIAIEPASASLALGDFVAVEARVDAGAQQVDRVEVFIDYNPAVLQVVDARDSPASSITPGTALGQVSQTGWITLRGRSPSAPAAQGTLPADRRPGCFRWPQPASKPSPGETATSHSRWRRPV